MTSDNNLFIHETDIINVKYYEKTERRETEFITISIASNCCNDKQDSEIIIYFNQEQYAKLIELRDNISNILQTLSINEG